MPYLGLLSDFGPRGRRGLASLPRAGDFSTPPLTATSKGTKVDS